jgi:hypothetical protein
MLDVMNTYVLDQLLLGLNLDLKLTTKYVLMLNLPTLKT